MRSEGGYRASIGTLVVLAAGFASGAAAGTMGAEVARCAAISAADARLACYDALAGSRPQPGTAGTPAVGSEPRVAAPAAATGAPPRPAATARAPTAVATTAAASSAGDSAADGFGRDTRAPPAPEPGAKEVKALVQKVDVDQQGRVRVSLDNGQVWDFTEADAVTTVRPGEAITIRRATFGSFLLTNSSRHTYRVRRRQ